MMAEEFFRWVRDCAVELEGMPETGEEAAAARAGSGMATRSPGTPDPIGARVAARVDAEERLRLRRERLRRVLDRGRLVAHMVGLAMGESAMVALRAYYVDLEDLDLIAMELQVSLRTLYSLRHRAFEYIDCAGLVKDDEKIVR